LISRLHHHFVLQCNNAIGAGAAWATSATTHPKFDCVCLTLDGSINNCHGYLIFIAPIEFNRKTDDYLLRWQYLFALRYDIIMKEVF